VLYVLEHGAPGEVYNVSAGEEQMNLSMAEWILDALGKSHQLIRHVEDRPGHDRRYSLSASKIRRLGWQPSISLEQGLLTTIDWYRRERGWGERIKSGEYQKFYSSMYRQRLGFQAS
jgi:dTDP-glucose 4,6-dehydratase